MADSSVERVQYQFKPRVRGMKRPLKVLLVAALAVTLLTLTVVATPVGESIQQELFGGAFLLYAKENNQLDQPLVSAKDQNITMKVLSAVAGNERIILNIQLLGLKDLPEDITLRPGNLQLVDQEGNRFASTREYQVTHTPYADLDGNSRVETVEFAGAIGKTQKVSLQVDKIGDVKGSWNLIFELTYQPTETVEINKVFNIHGGQMFVHRVIIDTFSTILEYTVEFKQDTHIGVMLDFENTFKFNYEGGMGVFTKDLEETQKNGTILHRLVYPAVPRDNTMKIIVMYDDENKGGAGYYDDLIKDEFIVDLK